ncbi:MAG: ferrochelatase [Gammaproteobacteria bacterium]|nr:ferrochelatase [Gammaproteobacteria bacterium]MCD8543186.1 ferrochelatase [Gammaproteobacteria bacterium]
MKKTALIVINLGTPQAPSSSAIRTFLRKFLSDKRVVKLPRWFWLPILYGLILPFRPKKLVSAYQAIWTTEGSPLESGMKNLVHRIQRPPYEVRYAMSYSQPSLSSVIKKCVMDTSYHRIILIPLYPQYTSSTTGAVFDEISKNLQQNRWIPNLSFIHSYYDHPLYICALAHSVKEFWDKNPKPQRLIMSFHGIPQREVDKGDPYAIHCQTTAEKLAHALGLEKHEWMLVYQSRFGKAPWLQPYCDKTLQSLPPQGITHVHIICPGFAMDCLETLEEIAVTNKKQFLQAGGKSYDYIPALNASEQQCQLITALIEDTLA